jgi:hypothetical protein
MLCYAYEEERDVYNILVGKLERIRPRGRCRCKWEDYIKIYIAEI